MKGVKQYLCFEILVRESIFILDPLSLFSNSRILATNTTVKPITAQTRVTTKTTSGTRKVVLATMERTVTKTKPAERNAIKTVRNGSPKL